MIEKPEPFLGMEPEGIFLHGSSIVLPQGGLVFLGHSSSGKSTIARLLSREFQAISDDKVIVFRRGERWMVKSGDSRNKFTGEEGVRVFKGHSPLAAFVRIYPATQNSIHPLDGVSLCKCLLDAVFEVDRQRRDADVGTRKRWFQTAVELAKSIPGWKLGFQKDVSIVEFIQESFDTDLACEKKRRNVDE